MGAALSIFVLLSLSVFVVRVASVALRLTGLDDSSARFQALSAFSGTGFTTLEAEAIVNYPLRRKIVSVLMIVGNVGLVGVFATLVASLVHTEGEWSAVLLQLAWLVAVLALLWFVILNKTADRMLCRLIGRVLEARTIIGRRPYHRLLQLGSGLSICEHSIPATLLDEEGRLSAEKLASLELEVLAVRTADGVLERAGVERSLEDAVGVVLIGGDAGHEALAPLEKLELARGSGTFRS